MSGRRPRSVASASRRLGPREDPRHCPVVSKERRRASVERVHLDEERKSKKKPYCSTLSQSSRCQRPCSLSEPLFPSLFFFLQPQPSLQTTGHNVSKEARRRGRERERERETRTEVGQERLLLPPCSPPSSSSSLSLLSLGLEKKKKKKKNQGCVACLSLIFRDGQQQGSALCPLCRAPFSRVPAPNHELRELVSLAAALAPHHHGGSSSCSSSDDGGGGGGGGEGDESEEGGGGERGGAQHDDEWTDVARPGQILRRRRRNRRQRKEQGDEDEGGEGARERHDASLPLALAAFPLPSAAAASGHHRRPPSSSPSASSSSPLPPHRVTVGAVRAGLADPWDLEPPASWEPDSASPACTCCGSAFAGLVIGGGGGGGRRRRRSGNAADGGGGGGDLSASTSSSAIPSNCKGTIFYMSRAPTFKTRFVFGEFLKLLSIPGS